MKLILYYLSLLVLIAIVTGFVLSQNGATTMGTAQMLGVSAGLILYTIAIALVGESPSIDEREIHHRYVSNRAAMIAATVVFSIGIMYQLFISHHLNYILLIGLIAMNLTKIVSLIYLSNKQTVVIKDPQ